MKVKNFRIAFQLMLAFSLVWHGQGISQGLISSGNFIPKTPEASIITTYGDIQNNGNNGLPDITIPIHTIVLDNVEIPITISYAADGIRVNEIPTPVGLKWALSTGGMVSRNIVGVPDEAALGPVGWRNMGGNNFHEKLNNATHVPCHVDTEYNKDFYTLQLDHAPDLFSYSIPEGSGRFIFRRDGGYLEALKSNLVIDFNETLDYFKIVTSTGISYLMDKKEKNWTRTLDYSGPFLAEFPVVWKPSKIKSSIGNEILFEYEEYEYSTGFYIDSWVYTEEAYMAGVSYPEGILGIKPTSVRSDARIQLVKRISTDHEIVKFCYSFDETLPVMKAKLDTIKIFQKNDLSYPIKQVRFVYDQYPTPSSQYINWLRLKEVRFIGENDVPENLYSFEYNSGAIPALGSFKQDVFGYINNNQQFHMIPIMPAGVYTPANREVCHTSIQFGVLEKIIFPTGGSTSFFWEPNRDRNGQQFVYYPGLRLRRTIDNDRENNIVGEREYEYNGVLSNEKRVVGQPFFEFSHISLETHSFCYPVNQYSSNKINPIFSLAPNYSFFGYKEIKTIYPGNGYKTNFFQLESEFNYQSWSNYKTIEVDLMGDTLKKSIRNFGFQPSSNGDNDFEKEQFLFFDNDPYFYKGFISCNTTGVFCSCIAMCPNISIFYPPLIQFSFLGMDKKLQSQVLVEFFDNKKVKTITTFNYNENQLLTEQQTSRIGENNQVADTEKNTFRYVVDDNTGWISDTVRNSLIDANIISIPLLSEKFSDGSLKIEGSKLFLNDKGQVLKQYAWETENQSTGEGSYKLFGKYEYDPLSHRLIESEILTFPASYIWGYNHTLPIAKLENISQNQIPSNLKNLIQQLENFTGDLTASDRAGIINLNNQIRGDAPPMVMITTYTHKPLVGVTSITDPRGQTIFYEYDSFGRLKAIRDQDGKILEENEYHYAQPQYLAK